MQAAAAAARVGAGLGGGVRRALLGSRRRWTEEEGFATGCNVSETLSVDLSVSQTWH